MLTIPATFEDIARPMRIGILVTNTDRSAYAKTQPDDGEKYRRLMQSVRPHWDYRAYDCVAGIFPQDLSECEGYIIGGSPASVNDPDEWIKDLFQLIRQLHSSQHPMVGCCFGHQAIAKALGGDVQHNAGGWGFGVAETTFETPRPWMQPSAEKLALYSAHSEQVTQLPRGAVVLGGSAFCPFGSFAVGEHIMSTEYHPEMSRDFFVGLTHAFETYVGHDVAAAARRQAEQPAQGQIFAEWMARFFEGQPKRQ